MNAERTDARAGVATGTGSAQDAAVSQTYDGKRRMVDVARGRTDAQKARIDLILDAVIELGLEVATRRRVAQVLGRVDEDGREQTDFKKDVRAAGTWSGIMLQARSRMDEEALS